MRVFLNAITELNAIKKIYLILRSGPLGRVSKDALCLCSEDRDLTIGVRSVRPERLPPER